MFCLYTYIHPCLKRTQDAICLKTRKGFVLVFSLFCNLSLLQLFSSFHLFSFETIAIIHWVIQVHKCQHSPSHSGLLSGNYWFLGEINNQQSGLKRKSANFMNGFLSELHKLFPKTRGYLTLVSYGRNTNVWNSFASKSAAALLNNQHFVTIGPPQFIAPSPKTCPATNLFFCVASVAGHLAFVTGFAKFCVPTF